MTNERLRQINAQRLGSWAAILEREHATAFALIAIGHDRRSGQTTLCSLDDVPDEQTAALILHCASQLLTSTIQERTNEHRQTPLR
jgi:hypothetical protein